MKKVLFFLVLVNLAAAALTDTITQYGITWKFSAQVETGQFINGDYYVVGNCTVVSIDPVPGGGRNGCELNPALNDSKSGYDSREEAGRYDGSMCTALPINMKPGDALISTISASVAEFKTIPNWLRKADKSNCPVKSACVLTCVSAALSADAFRPSYCDRTQKIYYGKNLKRNILPSLPYGRETYDTDQGALTLKEFEDKFIRVWLNLVFFHFDAPAEYQPQYGREHGRAMGLASLILMTDLPLAKKEKLLIGLVQNGIDLWGIAKAGFHGWQAFGGHGSGRKWPIVFAGKMLGDTDMSQPTVTLPNLEFGEDMQTLYKTSWTGAKVVYAGHNGVDKNGNDVNSALGWGQYEHLEPKDWPIYAAEPGMNEMYRRCCTSHAWVGMMLCAKIMHAEKLWNHDAFFDYVDRWMTEDDTGFMQTIKTQTNKVPYTNFSYAPNGLDFTASSYAWQRQTWDGFVNQMWANFRNNLPPDLDGTVITTTGSGNGSTEVRVVVYPSPAKIARTGGSTIKIANLAAGSIIKIYNAQGVLVTTINPGTSRGRTNYITSSVAEWDATDDNNSTVASGIYYCMTEDPAGNRRKGKIALVR